MGKTIKNIIVVIFSLALFLNAGDLSNSIYSANKKIHTSSKEELTRVHHNLKNLYIKTIIAGDKKLQISALEGLIDSSKILKLKYNHYEEELKLLTKDQKIDTPKIQKKEPKKKAKKEPVKSSKKDKKSHKSLRIKNISSDSNSITISFDTIPSKEDVKFFEINRKNSYRDIFDIEANFYFKIKPLKITSVKRVEIAQNDKNKVRIVIENEKPIKSKFSLKENKMIISLPALGKSSPKKKSFVKKSVAKKSSSGKKTLYASSKTIIIDPGHGGKDVGAIGYKRYYEKNAILKISLVLGKELKSRGYKVFYTRAKDKFVRLRNRTGYANKKEADVFISLHANAAPRKSKRLSYKGVETYFLSPARSKRAKRVAAKENVSDMKQMDYFSKQTFLNFLNREKIIASNKLAIDIQQGMLDSLRRKYKVTDGGVREAPFWVLVGAQMPSVLVEVGYITNPTEAKRMFNGYYRKLLAKGVADGIENYFFKNN